MAEEQRTVLNVYNLAMGYCKAARIFLESEPTVAAEECNLHYPRIRRRMLRAGKPNFASKLVTLTKDLEAPAFGFTNRFLIPSDCLSLNVLNRTNPCAYRVIGRYIHADVDEIELEYTFDEKTLTNWDALYYEMLSIALAKAVVLKLTEDLGRIQVVNALYTESKVESLFSDSAEGTPEETGLESDWLGSRNGFTEGDRTWGSRAL